MVMKLKHKYRHRESLFIKKQIGVTLIEMLVTVLIISILSSVALPFAEMTIRRSNENDLRAALREVRTAVDYFHADWKMGKIPLTSSSASEYGYPKTLDVLINGVTHGGAASISHKYLRRIPKDPFADKSDETSQHWQFRSYQDAADSSIWGQQDVYDLRSKSEKQAIDGTYYKDW